MEEGAFIAIILIFRLVAAVISAVIANAKGRSVAGWFFGGLLLELIGIIIVAVLPNLKAQREKEAYAERENRRLREQLRQERIKAESFRQNTQARLDSHDQHLGLDTRTATYQLTGPEHQHAGLLEGGQGFQGDATQTQWYYEQAGQAIGPTTAEDIKQQLTGGTLSGGTLVWAESLGDWAPAHAVPEFQSYAQV